VSTLPSPFALLHDHTVPQRTGENSNFFDPQIRERHTRSLSLTSPNGTLAVRNPVWQCPTGMASPTFASAQKGLRKRDGFLAILVNGRRFDIGTPEAYVETVAAYCREETE